ncbi:pyridoxal phosphate-dependent decarboxylase family protein [Lysinibacillus sp. 54212]|uniref:pyridoxal phosphate-dependent decarboxylase family protein n=1 Tax=Lysinibacillus sp. 54212 TaxID=3119829 RepID=UPI002FCC7A62
MKRLPSKGLPKGQLFEEMQEARAHDANWKDGRTFSLVYYAGEELSNVAKEAYNLFFHENGLNPMAFKSLQKFETEVLSMASSLFYGDEKVVGSLTSGGSESILMAVKAYRDWARKHRPHIKEPEMIVPTTVHAAFEKAAHYFGVKAIHAPVDNQFQVDVEEVKALINDNTILLVGSAPNYPQGIVDPIEQLGEIAEAHRIPLHVDACLGGFILPFIERLGGHIAPFDFRVPGVTSISADVHKYGYAAKGVSAILYRDEEYRRCQYFAYGDWPGGLFASPTATGTRPGGAIASAWAVMKYLGEEGYSELASKTMQATNKFLDGLATIPELQILGNPRASIFTIASNEVNIFALADTLEQRGWHIDRQQLPTCLHFMITPAHLHVADAFILDLKESVQFALDNPNLAQEGTAAMYGMIGQMPDKSKIHDFIIQTLDSTMRLR